MAGHSKFANIKHRKGAQDKKRAKRFAVLVKQIMIAARDGSDADGNPKLRKALLDARAENLPKDRIEKAINKASNNDGNNYEEINYEGYGKGGVAYIVETLTDNKNRTAAFIRSTFTKYTGTLAESGSVSYMFKRVAIIKYKAELDFDEVFELAAENQADDISTQENYHMIQCPFDQFTRLRDKMIEKFGNPEEISIEWISDVTAEVDLDAAKTNFNLIEILEDNDDVNNVSTNMIVSNDVIEQINK